MSEEEKKAIEVLSGKRNETTWNDTIRQIKRKEITDVVVTRQKYIKTILNLIEKQQKELEKKDKIIDLMANNIADSSNVYENLVNTEFEHTKEEVIEYFTKKAEENNG